MMAVRLKRNIRSAAFRSITGLFERNDLSVRHAVKRISSLADNLAVSRNDHAADERIRADEADARSRKVQSPAAKFNIFVISRRNTVHC